MNFQNSNRKWNCQTEREKFLCDISIKLLEKTENSGISPSAEELLFLQMAITECGGMYEWVQAEGEAWRNLRMQKKWTSPKQIG